MRERILLRHIGQQALWSIDNDDFTETEWRDWLQEVTMDIAIMLSGEQLETFEDVRRVIE